MEEGLFFINTKLKSMGLLVQSMIPFLVSDIVSSLNTLSNLEFTISHPQIKLTLNTLRERQLEDGLWDLK